MNYAGETRLLFYYIYIAYQKAGEVNDFYHQHETQHLMSNAWCIGWDWVLIGQGGEETEQLLRNDRR